MPGQVVRDRDELVAIKHLEGKRILSRWPRLTGKDEVEGPLELWDRIAGLIDLIKGAYHRHDIGLQSRWPLPVTRVSRCRAGGAVSKVDIGHGSLVSHYSLVVLLSCRRIQDRLAQAKSHFLDERRRFVVSLAS